MNRRLFRIAEDFCCYHDFIPVGLFVGTIIFFIPALVLNLVGLVGYETSAGEMVYGVGFLWAIPFDLGLLLCGGPLIWYLLSWCKYEWWPEVIEDLGKIIRRIDG